MKIINYSRVGKTECAHHFFLVFFLLSLTKPVLAQSSLPVYTEEKPLLMVTASQPLFVIKLKSNPTTGYSWFLREYDDKLIVPLKHSVEAPANKKILGAPGYETWTFKVTPAGFTVPQQTLIRFVYARPWEAEDSSTQIVFKVTTSTG